VINYADGKLMAMYLRKLRIENFRIFGARAENQQSRDEHLELEIRRGLTLLVGENDSGKTAIVDALRLVLGTTSQDFHRITEDDFHLTAGKRAEEFTIYCRFEGLSDEEAARFLEWLSYEDPRPVLEVTFSALWSKRKNRHGVEVQFPDVTNHSGPNGKGKAIEGEIRTYLRLTYLKPLRDALMEMSSGRGSRLSRLLQNYPSIKDQGEPSEIPPVTEGEVPQPPRTLLGIMNLAEKWIQGSSAIQDAKKQLNDDYLSQISVGTERLLGEISIGEKSNLRSILEKLELWLKTELSSAEDRTPHGLGLNNLLFMAAELLLLSESSDIGLPLLVIEEPEAHLHPQLQLRLMEFLEKKTSGKSGVQVVVTTHSPNLSSKAEIENITMMVSGRAYSLASEYTKLNEGGYRFLRRFLDVTKANLFFAKGVVLVEGDAENILLPSIAQLLGRSFSEHGVSIVNVGHRGLFRYARIFQRRDGSSVPVRVACITDRDLIPAEARQYVSRKRGRRFEDDVLKADGLESHLSTLTKNDGGNVRTFPSDKWTLEHDLAAAGLGLELHMAISIARKLKRRESTLSPEEWLDIESKAAHVFDLLSKRLKPEELWVRVYQPLYSNQASKAETAQVLSAMLTKTEATTEQIGQKLPRYLVDAIEYVTEGPEGE
jgi:putative ATP-dependent endonuclease of the OLD family